MGVPPMLFLKKGEHGRDAHATHMQGAKVTSIDALRGFRAALIKFAEVAGSALTDADSDVRGTLMWLERDQMTYWTGQIRKRHDALERAKEALRLKQLYKSPSGGRQSDVDEMKAVAKAKAALQEAETKLVNAKKSAQKLHKQMMEFTGQIQRLSSTVQSNVPRAIAELDRMVAVLDEYVSLHSPSAVRSAADADAAGMGRGAAEAPTATPVDWRSLRARTPGPSARAGAERGLVSFGQWKSGVVKVAQQDALRSLVMAPMPVEPGQIVLLARNVNDQERIYLQRMEPAFPGDSGWYIGPAQGDDEPTLAALVASQVLAMRPDFANILPLPRGVLLGMDAQGIAALLISDDTDVWASESPSPQPSPGVPGEGEEE